jgi:hypothetical protein
MDWFYPCTILKIMDNCYEIFILRQYKTVVPSGSCVSEIYFCMSKKSIELSMNMYN